MQVEFTVEQLQRLSRIAAHAGTEPERLVRDAALRMVEQDEKFPSAVREGIEQANRGEFFDDDEARLWLEERERS